MVSIDVEGSIKLRDVRLLSSGLRSPLPDIGAASPNPDIVT